MSSFIPLVVKKVTKETDSCVSLEFDIPEGKHDFLRYKSGQYITLKKEIDGEDVRRSYSIWTAPHEGRLAVAVKKVDGGKMSTHLNEIIQPGDTIEATTPEGRFLIRPEGAARREHYFVAGGSGITPVISMIKTVLEEEPMSTCYLYYGSRNLDEIIFKEELENLIQKYSGQLIVHHTLSRPKKKRFRGPLGWLGIKYRPWKGEEGRIDIPKFINFLEKFPPRFGEQHYYLCGPGELIAMCNRILQDRKVDKKYIHKEYFTPPEPTGADLVGVKSTMKVTLRGKEYEVEVLPENTLLESMLTQGLNPPYSCTSGACSSCIARVLEGSVEMENNFALDDDEIKNGYVLTCQSHATTPELTVLFKEVGDLEHE